MHKLEGKYSLESTDPRESEIRNHLRNSLLSELSWECITYLLCVKWFVGLFTLEIGLFTLEKNPRFTAFLDSNLHTRLVIVTENELGLAFPPRNLPKKFRPDPSTCYLVIVVTNKQTDRQTDRQTNAGDYIIPRESFRGDNNGHRAARRALSAQVEICFAVMQNDKDELLRAQFWLRVVSLTLRLLFICVN